MCYENIKRNEGQAMFGHLPFLCGCLASKKGGTFLFGPGWPAAATCLPCPKASHWKVKVPTKENKDFMHNTAWYSFVSQTPNNLYIKDIKETIRLS